MTHREQDNPYVFFVGCARSGTTLLKRIVQTHPDLAVTPETHWIPRVRRMGVGIDELGRVTPDLLGALADQPRFGRLGVPLAEVELMLRDRPTYADLISRLFDRFGESRGKRYVGDKTPGYTNHVDLLHRLWPRARFVHLVRDGRDVCLSHLEWKLAPGIMRRFPTWDEDPVSTLALWWKRSVSRALKACARLPPELRHELRYEALVGNLEDECRRLCSFLGLPFDAAMLRFHEGRTRTDPGLTSKQAWLPPTPGLRDWRTQMSADALERFAAIAGGLLEELGYEPSPVAPSARALRHAAYIERACARENRGRRISAEEGGDRAAT